LCDKAGEEIVLHVFIDHSVMEIFAGRGRTSFTWRMYPSEPDNDGVGIFVSRGKVEVVSIDAWTMG
jgi:beta-fructofuranosidase